jgi:hypothetical protein
MNILNQLYFFILTIYTNSSQTPYTFHISILTYITHNQYNIIIQLINQPYNSNNKHDIFILTIYKLSINYYYY